MIRESILLFLAASLVSSCALVPSAWMDKPLYVEDRLKEARDLMTERDFSSALVVLSNLTPSGPLASEMYYLKGESYFRMTRYADAEVAYEKALSLDARHHASRIGLWMTRLAGSPDTATAQIQKEIARDALSLIKQWPSDTPAALAASKGFHLADDQAASFNVFVRVLEWGDYQDARAQLAQSLFGLVRTLRDPEKRIELSGMFLDHFPESVYSGVTARLLFHGLKQINSPDATVLSYASNYARLENAHPPLKLAVAWGLLHHELAQEQALEMLDSIEPDSGLSYQAAAEIPYLQGVAWMQMENWRRAKERLLTAVDRDPKHARSHHRLGLIYKRDHRVDEALYHFREALRFSSNLPDARVQLGALLAQAQGFEDDPQEYFARKENLVQFEDVTERAGLGGIRAHRLAWGDFDDDGHMDLLANGSRLLHNDGQGGFEDVTSKSGLAHLSGTNGGLWGDYDNDGDPDIFTTSKRGTHLLENRQGKGFEDVSGRTLPAMDLVPVEAVAWGDLDNDGFLDLYLASYERSLPILGICLPDRLLRNRGDGSFEKSSVEAGLINGEPMCGRGVLWEDINRDGLQDILVSNYRLDPNLLWINNGDGTFSDDALRFGVRGRNDNGYYGHTIGAAVGDINGDGDLDIFLSNLAHPAFLEYSDLSMLLYRSGSEAPLFMDRFNLSGIAYEETSSDPSFADIDNDGDLDLFVTSIYPGRYSHLYLNDGEGKFTDVSWASGARVENGWGAAFADFDNDGAMDLAVSSKGRIRLLKNRGNSNHWLDVEMRMASCNYQGIGSRVRLRFGDREQIRTLSAGRGTGNQDAPVAHFGLGEYRGVVEIEADTLCGDRFKVRVYGTDRLLQIRQAESPRR